jgi:hypothetical protein
MKLITAKILDATHLELSQPLFFHQGDTIQISIPEFDEEKQVWLDASKTNFLEAYDEEDAIYDKL